VNTTYVKLAAFTISSAMCGALGAFYAHYIGSIDPSVFGIILSATALVMVLAGGWGTILGPIIGAIVLTYLPEWLRVLQDYRMSLYGAILILIILFMPQGVLGLISRLSSLLWRKGPAREEVESNAA
jgi:branched-chain amino acid transport system permease protein